MRYDYPSALAAVDQYILLLRSLRAEPSLTNYLKALWKLGSNSIDDIDKRGGGGGWLPKFEDHAYVWIQD